jgi:hypothetical protein
MSFINESFNIGKKNMVVGNGKEDFDISCINGYEVKINGIVPGAGGGGGVPAVGDISFIGNLDVNDVPGGGAKGIITAEKKVVAGLDGFETSGNIEITSNGNLTLNGNGTILQLGGGKISSGQGGIESYGDIKTVGSFDLEIGKDIYFDGTDIYHRTNNPVAQKSYKDYKQLPGLNDANKFTGANEFNTNTTEFAAKVSVGTRDSVSLVFTENLALNTDGNIQSKTINNGTTIQCGNINCGNAGENQVRARQFNTRTNEHNLPEGWVIEQALPSNPAQPVDKILQIKAQEAGGVVSITPSDFSGTNPAIILDPNTTAAGGKIYAANFTLGSTVDRYRLTQDITGGLSDTLQISAPTTNSKVEFRDNSNNVILYVKKTLLELGSTIPIKFGNYEFRPIEITYAFTGATLDSNPPVLFNSATTNFTRTNDGATVKLNDLGEAVYILSIDAGSSSGTTIGSSRFMCNFPYMVSANASGSFSFSGNFMMNITPPAGFAEPTIEGDGTNGPIGSTDYSFAFSSITGSETYNGTVKITRLSY